MVEDELEELGKIKNPLVQKFLSHYVDAFFVSPSKKLRAAQLEVIELVIEDAGKLKNLKKLMADLGITPTESEKEAISLTLFGNKEIFDQAMKFIEKVPVMLAGLKDSEIACEISRHEDATPIKGKNKKLPKGVALG